jgi:hypothetical protein
MERWGQYFKPAGMSAPSTNAATNSRVSSAPASTEEDDPPFDSAAATPAKPVATESEKTGSEASSRAADIIAMIRNRNKQ